ncbi:MAG: dTMP kinase [Simkaniaceae bacterium]|nr:dTMP kinase [Simkaniaceae bacterium]MCF7852854.1 dTMP kinase [Simkaniaceae bacterium]
MKRQLDRGFFFTFEGGEGSGKTTLVTRVCRELQALGFPLVQSREPGGTPLGEKIRSLLLTPGESISKRAEILLFLADRSHHIETKIKPALEESKIVICDRYIDSTYAYQGLYYERLQLEPLVEFATQKLIPDLTFYLDIPPELGFQRANQGGRLELDRIESFSLTFHQQVREGFHELVKREPHRIMLIDASQSKDAVFHQVWEHLMKKLQVDV